MNIKPAFENFSNQRIIGTASMHEDKK
jgi:hypothetical protein